jgi:acyl dehydratase
MGTVVDTFSELTPLIGADLGESSWIEVDQDRINTFARATDDYQWIHTDQERAKDGPFGQTIAHGYLTLALLIPLWSELLEVREASTKVNYGLGKVRFPAPVPAGSRVRLRATLAAVDPVPGGVQVTVDAIMECAGVAKPVCVAQPIFRFLA